MTECPVHVGPPGWAHSALCHTRSSTHERSATPLNLDDTSRGVRDGASARSLAVWWKAWCEAISVPPERPAAGPRHSPGSLTSRVSLPALACCRAEMASTNPACPHAGAMVGLFQLSRCTWLRGSFTQLHAWSKDHDKSPAQPREGTPPSSASPSTPEVLGGSKLGSTQV